MHKTTWKISVKAAVELPHAFPSDAANDYGETTALIIKLQNEGVDSATAAKIATVDVTYAVETDFFQPQVIANSDAAPIGLYFSTGFACIVIGVLVKKRRLVED